jgi:hypothetical protein
MVDSAFSGVYLYTYEEAARSSKLSKMMVGVKRPEKAVMSSSSILRKPGRVTVPHPTRDIPVGTLRSIEKQSGLKLR